MEQKEWKPFTEEVQELLFDQMKLLAEKTQKEEDTITLCHLSKTMCDLALGIRNVGMLAKKRGSFYD